MGNKESLILKDTSLCAIVRDEVMNPAGGIQRFIESHIPYVEKAVIVDTGSIDGTREILEELESKYLNLKIYDHKFRGFGDARNFSRKKVETKYALVLDADELITIKKPTNEWGNIYNTMSNYPTQRLFNFSFQNVWPEEIDGPGDFWRGRLFRPTKTIFRGTVWENHDHKIPDSEGTLKNIAIIRHFLPSVDDNLLKERMFYNQIKLKNRKIKEIASPSKIDGFSQWKKYNPHRDKFK